jgi:hypothetical protein
MANEAVGIKTGISIKKQTLDEKGEVKKTTFFFPDLGKSVEAENIDEARKIAEGDVKNSQPEQ